MKRIIDFIKSNGGYAKMNQLREAGFQTREIKKLVDDGKIEKVKSGLYKIWDFIDGETVNPSFIDVCKASPSSVICLISALDYHELSTINPSSIYAAIPKSKKPPVINYPPIKFYFWENLIYKIGIMKIKTTSGVVKIYDKEKTICDLFRYRNKLGEDIALEALKNYLQLKDFKIKKLNEYADKMRIKTIITPYIKAILA
jgi:predicted transcriptional regulator of viral defense system